MHFSNATEISHLLAVSKWARTNTVIREAARIAIDDHSMAARRDSHVEAQLLTAIARCVWLMMWVWQCCLLKSMQPRLTENNLLRSCGYRCAAKFIAGPLASCSVGPAAHNRSGCASTLQRLSRLWRTSGRRLVMNGIKCGTELNGCCALLQSMWGKHWRSGRHGVKHSAGNQFAEHWLMFCSRSGPCLFLRTTCPTKRR